MKKALFLAVALMGIASVNAATINWSVSGVYQPTTTTAASGYAAYLFTTAVAQADVIAAIEGGTFVADYSALALSSGETGTSGAVLKTGIGSYSGTTTDPTTVSLYTVIFDAALASVDAATSYAVNTTPVDLTFTSATGSKTAMFTGFSTANEWQSIPEPTSGLLLLVGGALLALRRKRA